MNARIFSKALWLAVVLHLLVPSASAQKDQKDKRPEMPTVSLGMVTGFPTGTYYRIGNDIKEMVKKDGVELLVKESKGSIENIDRISSKENAAIGIVQSDVIGFLTRSQEPESKRIAESLRMIFPLYNEEVHLIANHSVNRFEDLNGKTVIVGAAGSGSWLTSMNLFGLTGVRPAKMLRLTPEEGMVQVLSGKADAMIVVAGKPVKLFQNLQELAGSDSYAKLVEKVHFVPLEDKRIISEYAISSLDPEDYNLVKAKIPTIAVTSVLVSYDFSKEESSYAEKRCNELKRFSTSLTNRLPELLKTGHPKWKEVSLDAEVGTWKRDRCTLASTTTPAIENELLKTIQGHW